MTNTFTSARQPRVSAGSPAGGQFAEKQHSAPEAGLQAAQDADVARALELIERSAAKFARRYNYSSETRQDIVQDTVYDLLNQQKLYGLDEAHQAKLVNVAVRAVAQRYINPNVRHEDLTALNLLKQMVHSREQETGVKMTSAKIRALADEIRLGFPPGRRPGEMFWLENREFSLSMPVGEGGTVYGDLLPASDVESPFAEDSSALADTVDALSIRPRDSLLDRDGNAVERVTPSQVRAEAWNHLSEVTGAPTVSRGQIPRVRAASLRAEAAARVGGISGLARAWQNGDTSPADDAVLFAPFGDLSMKQREAVTDALLRKSEYADDLWDSAVTIAART